MKKVSLFSTLLLLGSVGLSQEAGVTSTNEKRNSIGVGVNLNNGLSNNFNLNYRRYYSKFNLKAEFSQSKFNSFSFHPHTRITLPDKNSKFLAVSNGDSYRHDENLNLGIEKAFRSKKLKPFVGLDLIIGRTSNFGRMGVYRFQNIFVEDDSRPTYYIESRDSVINDRNYNSVSGVAGIAGNLGVRYDLRKHFSIIFYGSFTNTYSFVMKSTDTYSSDSYKEYLDNTTSSNYFTSNISCFLSCNYSF